MTDKQKKTDVEIEKALECCLDYECGNCTDCPYYEEKSPMCLTRLAKDALDYINRLKSAIAEAQALCRKKVGDLKANDWIKMMKLAGYEVNLVSEKEKMEQVRKETAKEILQDLKGLLEGYIDTRTGETLYKQLAEKYGSEVEE